MSARCGTWHIRGDYETLSRQPERTFILGASIVMVAPGSGLVSSVGTVDIPVYPLSAYGVVYEERCPPKGYRSFRVIVGDSTMATMQVAEDWCDDELQAFLKELTIRRGQRAIMSLVR